MRLSSIQYLRAIASVLVVYCHAIDLQMKLSPSFQSSFYSLQNFGAIGVDIFFVISGFIISFISGEQIGVQSATAFIKKRFVRVNPAYYLSSLLLLVIILVNNGYDLPLKGILKTITIIPLFDNGENFWPSVSYIGWTLAFEWYFYLLYALLISLKVYNKDIIIILIIIFLVFLGSIFPINNVQYKFFTSPLSLEFAAGILLCIIYKKTGVIRLFGFSCLIISIWLMIKMIYDGFENISEAHVVLYDNKVALLRAFKWGGRECHACCWLPFWIQ